MLSKTRSTPVYSPAPGVIPDTITGPASNGSPVAADPDVAPRSLPLRRTGDPARALPPQSPPLAPARLRDPGRGPGRLPDRARGFEHRSGEGQLGVRQLTGLAGLAGPVRRDPRLAGRARRDRQRFTGAPVHRGARRWHLMTRTAQVTQAASATRKARAAPSSCPSRPR